MHANQNLLAVASQRNASTNTVLRVALAALLLPGLTQADTVTPSSTQSKATRAAQATSVNTQTVHFDIDAPRLSRALIQLTEQSGLQLIYPAGDKVIDFPAKPLTGRYTAEAALKQLLEDTGLEYEFLDAHTIAIVDPRAQPATSTSQNSDVQRASIRLAQYTEPAGNPAETQSSGASKESLEELVVHGARFNGEEVGTALKLPLSVKDTPQTVMAITGDVMEFASIKAFQDAYKVDATGGTSHRQDFGTVNYYRGFRQQSNNAVKVDGFRLRRDFNLDFALFERLEVVKGATSTLYGQNSIAGSMNAISKMPRSQFGGELKAEGGSFDHYRIDADLYGPLTDDGALSYRLIGARLEEDSYLDYAGQARTVIAPTLRYEFSPNTSMYARVTYQKSESTPNFPSGLQYLGSYSTALTSGFDPQLLRIPDVPRSYFSGATWNTLDTEVLLFQGSLTHRFADSWTLRVNAQHNKQDMFYNWKFPTDIQANGVPRGTEIERCQCDAEVNAGEINVYGDVELFGRRHTLFFGADYSEITNPEPGLYTSSSVAPTVSIYDPAFNTSVPRPATVADYEFYFQYQELQKDAGLTAQAVLRPLDKLTVVLGGRYSKDDYSYLSRFGFSSSVIASSTPYGVTERKKDKVIGQGGITYAITPDLNFYASYGQTYEPNISRVAPNRFVDPEEGEAKEVGLKGELSSRFAYSLAWFDLTRSNITQRNPAMPGFVLPIGTQRSRGVELSAQGTVVPGWEVFTSLGWMDAEYIEGQYRGLQPENAPEFGLSLFTSYEWQSGVLRGFGIGGGVVHKRGLKTFFTQRDLSGNFLEYDFGDITEVDLRMFRNLHHWRVQVAATNLLDEKYYSATLNSLSLGVNVNPGRAVLGQISYQF